MDDQVERIVEEYIASLKVKQKKNQHGPVDDRTLDGGRDNIHGEKANVVKRALDEKKKAVGAEQMSKEG